MATGARAEIDLGDGWVNRTGDALRRDPIKITRGQPDQGTRSDPGRCTLTLDNKDGRYSPRNPLSPYFGRLGRNTPIRVMVAGAEHHMRINSTPGKARTPSSSALDITDLDVRVDCALDSWTAPSDVAPTNLTVLISRADADASTPSWRLAVNHSGGLELSTSTTGTGANFTYVDVSTAVLNVPPSGRLTVRATLDVNNGAGGRTIRFYSGPSVDGPWTQVGNTVTQAGTMVLANPAAPLEVGHAKGTLRASAVGRIYRAQVRDGADGAVIADPDFTELAVGATTWTDSEGLGWTLVDDAEISDRRERFVGEVASWPVRWGLSGADVHAPIEAAGILRRLGQGARPLESTLRRQIPARGPIAYWPLEDESAATWAASPIAGVSPMFVEGVDWAAASSLPSSAPLPVVRSDGHVAGIYGVVPPPTGAAPTSWIAQLVYRIDEAPAAPETIFRVLSTGTVVEWVIQQSGTVANVIGYAPDASMVVNASASIGPDLYDQWVVVEFEVIQDGGNVDWLLVWKDVGGDAGAMLNTFAGSAGYPIAVGGAVGGWSADLDGMALGHVAVWHNKPRGQYDGSIDSWTGESAAARMLRLAGEESVPLFVHGDRDESEPVGFQGQSTLVDLLGEAADSDGGVLYEQSSAVGLAYRTRGTLYNQAPALELRYGVAHEVQPPLEPVDDDEHTRNDVTVQRKGGSSARAVLTEGPLSTAAPPDGVGLYAESVTLSLAADAQAEPIAAWRRHLGTWDEARYSSVRIALHKAPHLLDAACDIVSGDRITVGNLPPWLPPEDANLLVMGIDDEIDVETHYVTFNCASAGPWMVGTTDDPVYGRVDTDGSELAADVTSTATTITVDTDGDLWVTAAPALNANPGFESGTVGGWTSTGAVIDAVEMPSPVRGSWVLRIDPDGLSSFPRGESEVLLVTAGVQYIVSGWLKCVASRYIELNVNWFNSSGVYVDTSATPHDAVAGEWMWVQGTVTAPVGAARATIAPTIPSAATDEILYGDQVTLRPSSAAASPMDFPWDVTVGGERMTVTAVVGTSSPQTFTVTRSVNGIVKAHAAGSVVTESHPPYVAL